MHRGLGIGKSHRLEQLGRATLGVTPVEPEMPTHVLGQLATDREHRVERRERILEDHRELPAGHLAQLPARQPQQVPPAVADRSLNHGSVGKEAE